MPTSPLPPGSTVAAYYRDSGGPEQERSVDQQRAAVADYCRQHGLTLVREFADEASPGSSTIGRDAFRRMVAWLRELAPEPDEGNRQADAPGGVICWDMARFARNQLDSDYFRSDLRRRGYILIFINSPIPPGPMAPTFETVLSWKAAEDLEEMRKNIRRGMRSRILARGSDGGYLNLWPGKVPAGFRAERYELGRTRAGHPRLVQRIVPDRGRTWERVALAFELRAQGLPISRIHQDARLYRTVDGYVHLFKRRVYCGDLEWGGEVIEDWIEACVSRELWDQVQALPQRTWTLTSPRSGTGRYPLTGWLRCGACGGPMTGSTSTSSYKGRQYVYRRYRCAQAGHHFNGHTNFFPSAYDIEREVYAVLTREVLTPDALFSMLEGARPGDEDRDRLRAEVDELRAETGDLDIQIGRLVDQVERYGPDAEIAKRLTERRQEKQQTASRMARLERRVARAQAEPVPEAVIRAFCNHAREALLVGDVPAVREVLAQILRSVMVWPDGMGLVEYVAAFGDAQGRLERAKFRWCR